MGVVTESLPAATVYGPNQAAANSIAAELVQGRLDAVVHCADCCYTRICVTSDDPDVNTKLEYFSVNQGILFNADSTLTFTIYPDDCFQQMTQIYPQYVDGGPNIPDDFPSSPDQVTYNVYAGRLYGLFAIIPNGVSVTSLFNPGFSFGYDCDLGCAPASPSDTLLALPGLITYCPGIF